MLQVVAGCGCGRALSPGNEHELNLRASCHQRFLFMICEYLFDLKLDSTRLG